MQNNTDEKLEGEVDSVIYRSDDTGFAVIMLKSDGELYPVVGELGNVEEGEELVCTGRFVTHQKFGEQFKCELCERSLPKSASAIQRYLASGAIKGIGVITARAIVKKFGEKTLEVLETEPERLCEINHYMREHIMFIITGRVPVITFALEVLITSCRKQAYWQRRRT